MRASREMAGVYRILHWRDASGTRHPAPGRRRRPIETGTTRQDNQAAFNLFPPAAQLLRLLSKVPKCVVHENALPARIRMRRNGSSSWT
jgi:hypothetical protein